MGAVAIKRVVSPEAAPANTPRLDRLGMLLGLVRSHDRIAFKQLYDETAKPVYSVIYAMVRRHDLADEIAQETFVAIWKRAAQFDPSRGKAFSWIITIARNRTIDRLRRERVRQEDPLDSEVFEAAEEQLHVNPVVSIEAIAVRGALKKLKPEYRTALLLAYVRGCSHAEIAESMNVPLGTAKSYVRRGLERLQELI